MIENKFVKGIKQWCNNSNNVIEMIKIVVIITNIDNNDS